MGVSKQQLLNTVRQLKEYIDYTSSTSNYSENEIKKMIEDLWNKLDAEDAVTGGDSA